MLSFDGCQWCIREGAPASYIAEAGEGRPLCDILHGRGVDALAVRDFVSPSLDQLHDPFLFRDMERACARIFHAISRSERIVIHGDYDADGIGGSVLLFETISALGGDVEVFLPHRDEDGYGMHLGTVQGFVSAGFRVVITCDCGIANIEETALLQDAGVDVIVTDHHQFKDELPPAHALLHPGLPHETYPDKTLSGGGVAFKFSDGLLRMARALGHTPAPDDIEQFLCSRVDLAAMSTIADMVPLRGESRVIAHAGLMRLRDSSRPGFRALLSAMREITFSAETFSFGIAPKINAPGRMGNPRVAFDLLSTTDESRAFSLLADIEEINKSRRKSTKEALDEALNQIHHERQLEHAVLFAYAAHWPSGIVGLIAGRLKDMFHKPALVMAGRHAGVVGSGRSTTQVNIVRALDEVRDCLGKYGGHPQACGFSLKDPSLLPYFEERLRDVVAGMVDGSRARELVVDAELSLQDISWELIRDLERLEPFGMAHEQPLFVVRNVRVTDAKIIGSTDKTLLMHVSDGNGRLQKCVGFGKSDYVRRFHLGDSVDIVVGLGVNAYNGSREIQCALVDMRMHG